MFIRRTIHFNLAADGIVPPGGAGGGAAPVVPPAPAAPVPPAADTKPDAASITMPSDAFKARLAEEGTKAERKFLKSLGFEKAEDLQTVLTTARALQDAQKTDAEKAAARIKELEPQAARAATLAKRFEASVAVDFEKLPENIQKAIDKVADGDAEKRFDQMQVLRDAGLLGAVPAAPANPKAPANVAPPGTPPPPSGVKSKFQEWSELRAKSPVHASVFFQLHGPAIEASRPADS